MRSILACVFAGCTISAAFCADAPLPLPVMGDPLPETAWRGFSLPKSFQRNPELEMTMIDELTDYGRSLPVPSPEKPTYYAGHNAGYTERGERFGDHPPKPGHLGRLLQRALLTNGFVAADATHAPSLLLVFHYGTHHALDPQMRAMFPHLARRHVLERSILVGGRAFETSIARRMEFGDSILDHATRDEFLTEQAQQGLYFVIVSAYDYAAFRQGQRRLAWRASLTVNAIGVSMADSLPALILSAAPYLGRAMNGPDIVRRQVKRGVVTLGPAIVVEADAPPPRSKKSD